MGDREAGATRCACARAAALAPPLAMLAALGMLVTACRAEAEGTASAAAPSTTVAAVTSSTASGALPLCVDQRHLAVFDVDGLLTTDTVHPDDVTDWQAGAAGEPQERPGASEIVVTYRARGYEILYVTTAPPDAGRVDETLSDAVRDWLERRGFPVDAETHMYRFDGRGSPTLSVANELLRLSGSDISVDWGYTDDPDKVYAYETGGIAADHVFSLGDASASHGSVALPNGDLVAHFPAVQGLPAVCEAL